MKQIIKKALTDKKARSKAALKKIAMDDGVFVQWGS